MQRLPQRDERPVLVAAAGGTGAVPRRQRRCLVQKEQLGLAARRHYLPLSSLEGQRAGNPVLMGMRLQHVLLIVMQNATVAHQHSASGGGVKLAKGIDAVLQCHQLAPVKVRRERHGVGGRRRGRWLFPEPPLLLLSFFSE